MKKKYGRKSWLSIGALFALGSIAGAALVPASLYEFETYTPVDTQLNTAALVVGSGLALSSDVPANGGASSLSFDGTSLLDIRNSTYATNPTWPILHPSPSGNYDSSVAFWMKADASANGSGVNVLSDKTNSSVYRFQAYKSGTASLAINVRGLSDTVIPNMFDNQWHHVAVVIDQAADGSDTDGVKFYKDGVLFASEAGVTWYNWQDETMLGSAYLDFDTSFYNGLVDNVGIYTGKLTAGDVATLAAIPEPATFGLIGAFGAALIFVRRRFMT